MLHNLPAEVVISVSSILEFNDKLNLTATCRRLNGLISKTNLYEGLDLRGYKTQTEHIVQEFRRNPFKGIQVKVLELNLNDLSEEAISHLSSVFPNVTRFSSGGEDNYDDSHFTLSPISEPLATWLNTLEVYRSNIDWFPIWLSLEHHVFPRLTELEIVENLNFGIKLITKRGFKAHCYLPFIRNAPFLKKLTIVDVDVTLDFLEALHAGCPHIESLTLNPSVLLINNDALPEIIVPATTVTTLNIVNATCCDKNGLLLDYILKKYPGLRHLNLTLDEMYEEAMERLNLCYPDSIHYYIDSDYSGDIYESYDDVDDNGCGIKREEYKRLLFSHKSALDIYRSSASIFFSRLPKTITSLKVNADAFPNIIEILSKSDMKIIKFGAGSYGEPKNENKTRKQLSYLKYLTSLKIMDIGLELPSQISNQDPVSASITKLSIYIGMSRIHINWLLSAFPCLEELYINGFGSVVAQVDDETEINPRRTYSNLRKLQVHSAQLQAGIFEYIKLAAPNLKELNLDRLNALEKSEVHLDLTGWGLEKCSLHFYDQIISAHDRSCKITLDNITRRFIFHSDRGTITFPKKAARYRKYTNLLHASVVCDDIKHLTVHGFRIKKMGDDVIIVS